MTGVLYAILGLLAVVAVLVAGMLSVVITMASYLVDTQRSLAELQAQVAVLDGVVDSAVLLISGIADRIESAGSYAPALNALKDDLRARAEVLAAAVAANTVASPATVYPASGSPDLPLTDAQRLAAGSIGQPDPYQDELNRQGGPARVAADGRLGHDLEPYPDVYGVYPDQRERERLALLADGPMSQEERERRTAAGTMPPVERDRNGNPMPYAPLGVYGAATGTRAEHERAIKDGTLPAGTPWAGDRLPPGPDSRGLRPDAPYSQPGYPYGTPPTGGPARAADGTLLPSDRFDAAGLPVPIDRDPVHPFTGPGPGPRAADGRLVGGPLDPEGRGGLPSDPDAQPLSDVTITPSA